MPATGDVNVLALPMPSPVLMTFAVYPWNSDSAALGIEEVQCLPDRPVPDMIVDAERTGTLVTGAKRVVAGLRERGEIHDVKSSNGRRPDLHLPLKRDLTRRFVQQLETVAFELTGDRKFGPNRWISGVRKSDLPIGHIPAFVMIGYDLLQFNLVDIEYCGVGCPRFTGDRHLKASS